MALCRLAITLLSQWLRTDTSAHHQQATALRQQGIHEVQVLARGIDGKILSSHRSADCVSSGELASTSRSPLCRATRTEKNLALLQETLQAMRNVRPDMAQVIVGDGPGRAQLEKAISDAHFTGFVDKHELACHYASADMFVFPSLSETWGNVVTEAMASGLAVVAYRHAASAELIQTAITG